VSKQRHITVRVGGKTYLLHRLLWEMFNGSIPVGHVIHHIDGDAKNNRIENLACMTHAEHVRLHREKDGALPPSQKGRKRALHPIQCSHCGISALRAISNNTKHGRYCSTKCKNDAANARRYAA
jgi:HNH endonuclease